MALAAHSAEGEAKPNKSIMGKCRTSEQAKPQFAGRRLLFAATILYFTRPKPLGLPLGCSGLVLAKSGQMKDSGHLPTAKCRCPLGKVRPGLFSTQLIIRAKTQALEASQSNWEPIHGSLFHSTRGHSLLLRYCKPITRP